MKRRALSAVVLLAAVVAGPMPASAQDWPTKPVRIVVSFAPGGAADIWARLIAEPLSAALKQSVVIENRGGGGGMVAAQQVARAEPDGYTILMGGFASQILAPSVADNPGFDGLKDFSHIAYIGGPPLVWVVPPSSELRSVADLIAAAKADKFSGYASSGVGTLGHLVVEYVAQKQRAQAHAHSLQHRGLRRHHRRPRADGLVHLGRGARPVAGRHAARAGGDDRGAAARGAERADLQGTRLRSRRQHLVLVLRPEGHAEGDRAAAEPGDAAHPGHARSSRNARCRTRSIRSR